MGFKTVDAGMPENLDQLNPICGNQACKQIPLPLLLLRQWLLGYQRCSNWWQGDYPMNCGLFQTSWL